MGCWARRVPLTPRKRKGEHLSEQGLRWGAGKDVYRVAGGIHDRAAQDVAGD
jgi:hypothetical protein